MDASAFSTNERHNEYEATFRVSGRVTVTIIADSKEDAETKARAMMDDEEFGLDPNEADEVDLDFIRKTPPMYRVIRDGKIMQSGRLMEGDLPREPDERGF